MKTLSNVLNTIEGTEPQRTEFTFDALPDAKSAKTGVSVEYAYDEGKKWFVFRASYGRVDRAFDLMIKDGTYTYIAKRYVLKLYHGKRKRVPKHSFELILKHNILKLPLYRLNEVIW